MLPLRYPRIWMLFGWLLVASVVVGSLMPDAPLRGLQVPDKVQHAFSYGVLMVWFAGLYERNRHAWIALTVLTLGVVLEIIQSQLSYRSFDPTDLLANLGGVIVGFGLSFWLLAGWCQRLERHLTSRDS